MMLDEVRTTCPYCGVGCGVILEMDESHEGRRIVSVRGDPSHPANYGRLCTKGATLDLTTGPSLTAHNRLGEVLFRHQTDQDFQTAAWDAALEDLADRFAAIIAEHGPDAVAFYLSGQLLTEDYYAFNKLAKALIGTNNVDTNSRLCMSSAVAGYKLTLGADSVPCNYEDIELADCWLIAGSNMAYAHPVLYRRLEAARAQRPGSKLIVIDPRKTDTAKEADLHLSILPGTDVALFNAMLNVMLWEGWTDPSFISQYTEGFEGLKAKVRSFTPAYAAHICGVDEADIVTAARWFACSGSSLSLYCQGLNQSADGTGKNAALINLHLASGQIGKPGAGPFSLTGQPNAMGGREVGGLSNLLPAHRDLSSPLDRADIAQFWGVEQVPAKPGFSAVELFNALEDGKVKAVWIVCTNPAMSMPDLNRVHRALQNAELVILQEAFRGTETASFAHYILPATTWAERDGTVTNSERRISRVRPALPPWQKARADWAIATDFAQRLESRIRPQRRGLFPWKTVEAVWNEHRASTRGRDLDITGLSYSKLEQDGPQFWPFPEGHAPRERLYSRLEEPSFQTPNGKARFYVADYAPVAEPIDARYPIRLTTGRLRDQWHGMSRTGLVPRLFAHSPEPAIELHPNELTRRALRTGDLILVETRRGQVILPALASSDIAPGQAFIAMHWGGRWLGGRGYTNAELLSEGRSPAGRLGRHKTRPNAASLGVNGLTLPLFDPRSKQPELKHCAARISHAPLNARLVAFAWFEEDDLYAAKAQLESLYGRFAFASATPFGRERGGLLFRAADAVEIDVDATESIRSLFGLNLDGLLSYEDPKQGIKRLIRTEVEASSGDRRISSVLLLGDVKAERWLRDYLETAQSVNHLGLRLLAPSHTASAGFAARGRTVCSCLNVSQSAIESELKASSGPDDRVLKRLQSRLGCGTSCGSCLPELKQLIKQSASAKT